MSTYIYNDLIKKSLILSSYFNARSTPQQISNQLIPCEHIKKFSIDTFLYMHIYTGLLLSIIKYKYENNNNIELFNALINNLIIVIDNTTSSFDYLYDFSISGGVYTYTFYLQVFKANLTDFNNTKYKTYSDINIEKHKPKINNLNTLIGTITITNRSNDDTEIGYNASDAAINHTYSKTNYNSKTDNEKRNINEGSLDTRLKQLNKIIYDIINTNTENIISYLKYYSFYYQMILYNISIQVSLRTYYLNAITTGSAYQISSAKLGGGAVVDTTNSGIRYEIIIDTITSTAAPSLQTGDTIEITNTIGYPVAKSRIASISTVSGISTITLDSKEKGYYSTDLSTGSITYVYKRDGRTITPSGLNVNLSSSKPQVYFVKTSSPGSGYYLNPTITFSPTDYLTNSSITYEYKKTNIYGIEYVICKASTNSVAIKQLSGANVSLNSITITPYITTTSFNLNTYDSVANISTNEIRAAIIVAIQSNIYDMMNNITELAVNDIDDNTNYGSYDSYTLSKADYIKRIESLNRIIKDHKEYQENVNYKIKIYNDYSKNFKNIKRNANYLIYFLIFVITLTLILSILPTVSSNVKYTYYIVILILLSIFTYFYYINFKNVHMNEKFTDYNTNIIRSNTCIGVITYNDQTQTDRDNHANIINVIAITLNTYYKLYGDYINEFRTKITTFGNDTFTEDGNKYLNNIYLTKKNEIDLFKVRKVELTNSIEILKRHVLYLFNLILFICLFTIVLILGLLLYTIIPTMMISIISLCVILIIIIITYFTVVLTYPTRLIADKNYWAVHNPSKDTLARIS